MLCYPPLKVDHVVLKGCVAFMYESDISFALPLWPSGDSFALSHTHLVGFALEEEKRIGLSMHLENREGTGDLMLVKIRFFLLPFCVVIH